MPGRPFVVLLVYLALVDVFILAGAWAVGGITAALDDTTASVRVCAVEGDDLTTFLDVEPRFGRLPRRT